LKLLSSYSRFVVALVPWKRSSSGQIEKAFSAWFYFLAWTWRKQIHGESVVDDSTEYLEPYDLVGPACFFFVVLDVVLVDEFLHEKDHRNGVPAWMPHTLVVLPP
jgi:hypothetical protein